MTKTVHTDLVPTSALVVGFARTGQAVARALRSLGSSVTVIDDSPTSEQLLAASSMDVELVSAPSSTTVGELTRKSELVVVSPGVPPTNAVFNSAPAAPVISEIELAFRLARVPIVAITGTNGKTSVTSLVTAMLEDSGSAVQAAGNIGAPLIEAVLDDSLDLVVAEVSSFQLAWTFTFRPIVGTWLNFSPDHLDWHRDLVEYADAKAKIWQNQHADDVAIANVDDPVVSKYVARARSAVVTFGRASGDFSLRGDLLTGPGGETLMARSELYRQLPHDEMNALAACASALSAGASREACVAVLASSQPLPHRVAFVASIDGITYYDDSKATTPSAVVAAVAGFERVVLIAGGRNKGLDLSMIRTGAAALGDLRLVAVVAIGEATEEIAESFSGYVPVARAASMEEAVAHATSLAKEGAVVLLSPGCASFDWYRSYEERGDDFVRIVKSRALGSGAPR